MSKPHGQRVGRAVSPRKWQCGYGSRMTAVIQYQKPCTPALAGGRIHVFKGQLRMSKTGTQKSSGSLPSCCTGGNQYTVTVTLSHDHTSNQRQSQDPQPPAPSSCHAATHSLVRVLHRKLDFWPPNGRELCSQVLIAFGHMG